MIETHHSFLFETLVGSVKHNSHFLVPPLLVKSLRSYREATGCAARVVVVLAWSGYFKLQTLAEEHLVEVEARGSLVEAYLFACRLLEVRRSSLVVPFGVGVG